jgi:uncharacterized protein YkwD/uncharacterized membrane protein required for colicin V production
VNRIDAIVLLVLAVYAFLGYRRGFIAVALDWLGLAVAVTVAVSLSPSVGQWLAGQYRLLPIVGRVLAFLGLLLGIRLAWSLVEMLIWSRLPRQLRQSSANRVAGAIPGILQGGLIAALTLVAIAALPLPIIPRAEIAASPLGSTLLRWGVTTQSGVNRWLGGELRDLIAFRPPPLKPDERVELPFRATKTVPDTEAETAMLRLVNAERRRRGLSPLKMDEKLRQVARQHSRDMLARGYFAHQDPEGRSPFDRMRAAGIRYRAAGENLALAPDVETAHTGLMNSPGHRANILNRAFGKVGIGAIRADPYGIMFSQEFTN